MNAATLLLAMIPTAAPPEMSVASIAYTGDGKLLFVGTRADSGRATEPDTGRVYVWDLSKPELKAVVTGLPADLRVVQPTADGKRFVLIGSDGHGRKIEVWDATEKKRLHAFDTPPRSGETVASPDGKWVAFLPYPDALKRREDVRPRPTAKVWDTESGKPMAEAEKALADAAGSLAATPDGKRLIVASGMEYAEFEVATGKKATGWKRDKPVAGEFMESRLGAWVAAVPGVKGVVTVAPTAKRRQSYVVRLVTEKKDWFLAEFWDHASAPVVSPDGRWLLVSAASRANGHSTYVLKLDAEGIPELAEKPEFGRPARGEEKGPAWREWVLGEANRAGREVLPVLAFRPDGKRLLAGGAGGQLRVYDTEKKELKATLAVFPDGEWLITTPGGGYVGSAAQEKEQAKAGKDRDPAKVKEALGVK
jgi:WD40 repeat protein